jgi:anti-sigma factor ChrR (cupin superfamily)
MPWKPTKFPGIKIKVLYTYDSGITTALFKLEPGAVVPLHEHTALEQTYVIEGSLEDHECKAGRANSFGAPPAISTRQSRPAGRCCSAFSSSRTVSLTAKNFSQRQGIEARS